MRMLKASGSIESRMLISERTLALFVYAVPQSIPLSPPDSVSEVFFCGSCISLKYALSKEIY
jgi:hypothetical protein